MAEHITEDINPESAEISTPTVGSGMTGTTTLSVGGRTDPFYLTARFWKRFSVYLSISLSIASLIVAAYASLVTLPTSTLRALTVTGIIINAVSVALSAATSLDWKRDETLEKELAVLLHRMADVKENHVVLVAGPLGGMGHNVEEGRGVKKRSTIAGVSHE